VHGVQGAARGAARRERSLDRGQAARGRRVACAQCVDLVMPLSGSSLAVRQCQDLAWVICLGGAPRRAPDTRTAFCVD